MDVTGARHFAFAMNKLMQHIFRLALIAIIGFSACVVRGEGNARKIVSLFPQSAYGSSMDLMYDSFRQYVISNVTGKIEFDRVELIPRWHTDTELQHAWHNLMDARYRTDRPALLVIMGDDIYYNLTNDTHSTFTDIPKVLICYYPEKELPDKFLHNTCKVTLDINLSGTLEFALSLLPKTKEVVLVYGSTPVDEHLAEIQMKYFEPFKNRVSIRAMTDLTMDEYEKQLSSLPSDTIMLYSSILSDKAGERVSQHLFFQRFKNVINVPSFAFWTTSLGLGVVGGNMLSVEDLGILSAKQSVKILNGTSPSEIEPLSSMQMYHNRADWNVLRRWQIPITKLPKNTIIINRPDTIWHTHYKAFLTTIAIIIVLATLATVLLIQRQRLLQTRSKLQQNEQILKQSREKLRHLTHVLIETDEHYKSSLSRNLHDNFSQQIAVISIGLSKIEKLFTTDAEQAGCAVTELHEQISKLAHEIHDIAQQLHPTVVKDLGLCTALEALCNTIRHAHEIDLRLFCDEKLPEIKEDIALNLYRIAQEGLSNIAKHADAKEARLFLGVKDGNLYLKIEDSGCGFDSDSTIHNRGIGLTSMQERTNLCGGTFEIVSIPDEGTFITIKIPEEHWRA